MKYNTICSCNSNSSIHHKVVLFMVKYTPFADLTSTGTAEIRACMCSEEKIYNKGDIIMQFPTGSEKLGIITKGIAHLVRIDINGNKCIIDYYEENNVFGEIISPLSAVDTFYIQAKEKCSVTFIDYNKMLTRCKNNCEKHSIFLNNIILSAVQKSQRRIDILSQRSIREKLLTYFKYMTADSSKNQVTLPLSLSDLADYLSTDRSAMMREIKRMNNEGVIESASNVIKLTGLETGTADNV